MDKEWFEKAKERLQELFENNIGDTLWGGYPTLGTRDVTTAEAREEVERHLNLIYAVLERAVFDVLGTHFHYESKRMREIQGSRAMVWLKDDHISPFSAEWCCEALDIDREKIVAALEAVKDRRSGR